MAMVLNLLKIAFILIVAGVLISMFMKNPAAWGNNVGGFFSAIQTFVTSLINSSPLG